MDYKNIGAKLAPFISIIIELLQTPADYISKFQNYFKTTFVN